MPTPTGVSVKDALRHLVQQLDNNLGRPPATWKDYACRYCVGEDTNSEFVCGLHEAREVLAGPATGAIPMLLWCPECSERHIDVGEFVTKEHHTHACQQCDMVWRPAIVATVGVTHLPGFKDAL